MAAATDEAESVEASELQLSLKAGARKKSEEGRARR